MRVVVLAGGNSFERAISERSGARVEAALLHLGHDARVVDPGRGFGSVVTAGGIDCVFIALHGRGGDDGLVQEVLDIAGVPYTGAPSEVCRLASDKASAKALLVRHAIATPAFTTVSTAALQDLGENAVLARLPAILGMPFVVKPRFGGSGFGLHVVKTTDELAGALFSTLAYDRAALCEQYVTGREVAVTIVRGTPLPAVEIAPSYETGYDFDARYTPGMVDVSSPEDVAAECERIALLAASTLGCASFCRVDLLVPPSLQPVVLEVAVAPGLTETSPTTYALAAAGMPFEELVDQLVSDAVERHGLSGAE